MASRCMFGDAAAVDVANDVLLVVAPAGGDAGEQGWWRGGRLPTHRQG